MNKKSENRTTDEYGQGFRTGYAEVMADIDTGEVFDEAVYLNCLDHVRREYYYGYREGVRIALPKYRK